MPKPIIEEEQLRQNLLFLFDQGMKPKEAVQKINDTYGEILKLNKCHRWFKRFKSGNRDLKDAHRKGRPQKLDDKTLREMVDSDPCQTIEELSQKLGRPWTIIEERLHRIGKSYRQGRWIQAKNNPPDLPLVKHKD